MRSADARHLLERGFPEYGFVMQMNTWSSHRQFEGFRQVIEGEARRPCHLFNALVSGQVRRPENLALALQRLPKPIGVMCATDLLAQRLVDVAVSMGLRVPEDVAVLGVENNVWLSAIAATPLSSVIVDGQQIGYRAAQVLDAMLAGQSVPSAQWIPPIGVEDVLEAVGVSRTSLEVRLKRAVGKTPQVAIFSARVNRAKKMLVDSDMSVGQIARQCGFDRQERLNVVFKRMTGMTPGQFRDLRRTGRSPSVTA